MELRNFIIDKNDSIVITISNGEVFILVNNKEKIKPSYIELKSLKDTISILNCVVF